ncbi:MAG: HupE/UreJ family protein [Bacteroidota bacterium]|nr:HupE/UreJ family protein [Bacteroidota bacterium]
MFGFWDSVKMGWNHIIDFGAYDHILFITVLCALFQIQEWKKVLTIITAFTIGHSATLALSALDIIFIPAKIVEILIPATIVITAITNLIAKQSDGIKTFDKKVFKNYIIALCFGFIHGMGFANNFKFMLGNSVNIVKQLFAFNIGIEFGQLVVVLVIMLLYFLLIKIFNVKHRDWTLFLSGAGFGVGGVLLISNILDF